MLLSLEHPFLLVLLNMSHSWIESHLSEFSGTAASKPMTLSTKERFPPNYKPQSESITYYILERFWTCCSHDFQISPPWQMHEATRQYYDGFGQCAASDRLDLCPVALHGVRPAQMQHGSHALSFRGLGRQSILRKHY